MEAIRIVDLPAFHCVNFNRFGSSPELQAIGKLQVVGAEPIKSWRQPLFRFQQS